MNTIEHSNYIDIFHPNGMILDGDAEELYEKWNFEKEMEKMEVLNKILGENSLLNNDFIKKMKKILPNGLNMVNSFSNEEFDLLKKEFNV